jgi:hypothetical protein
MGSGWSTLLTEEFKFSSRHSNPVAEKFYSDPVRPALACPFGLTGSSCFDALYAGDAISFVSIWLSSRQPEGFKTDIVRAPVTLARSKGRSSKAAKHLLVVKPCRQTQWLS